MNEPNSKNKLLNQVYQSVFFSLILDPRPGGDILPIAVRVAYMNKKIFFRSGIKCTRDEFNKMLRATKGKLYEQQLEQISFFNKIVQIAKNLIDSDSFSLPNLKTKISGKAVTTIGSLFDIRIKALRESRQVKTAQVYQNAISKFFKFSADVELHKISPELIDKFKSFLEREKLSPTTISIYLRTFRAICNAAIDQGIMKASQYPFQRKRYESNKVKIPKGSKRKTRFLEVEKIIKIWDFCQDDTIKDNYNELVIEAALLWMFSYLGNGINLVDMSLLKYDKHYFKTEGKEFCFKRRKTERTLDDELLIFIPIIAPLKRIIETIGAKPKLGAFVFPQLLCGNTEEENIVKRIAQYNKNIAKRMEKVCSAVGLFDEITMTWARHSYQTNLAHKKVPESYIDQAVGHADSSVTDGYIGMYSTKDRFRYNSLLLEPDEEA